MRKTKQIATIEDVATHAGVSMMTVSRVLNGKKQVSSATRAKVRDSMVALDYRPNNSARNLSSNRSFTLALIYDIPNSDYVSKFLFSALATCKQHGYHLLVEQYDSQASDFTEKLTKLVSENNLEGLISLPPLSDDQSFIDVTEKQSIPCVRIGPINSQNKGTAICVNDYEASFANTETLIKNGHTNVGYIKGDPVQGTTHARYNGFVAAMNKHNLAVREEWVMQGDYSYESGMFAAENLLTQSIVPTAIFCSNDDMAVATIATAQRLGIKVPEQLSVVGFDDLDIARKTWPRLTTVRQPLQQMAEKAIELLVNGNSENEEANQSPYFIPFTLIERNTVAQPKS